MSESGEGSWWKRTVVLGPLGAGLVAIFVAVVTPVGEKVREFVFPTAAFVQGVVKKNQRSVPMITVSLDAKTDTKTGPGGGFVFEKVSSGAHFINVLSDRSQLLTQEPFFIGPGDKEKQLPPIELEATPEVTKLLEVAGRPALNPAFVVEQRQPEYVVNLMHRAVPVPPAERRPGFESNAYAVTTWVEASQQTLEHIARVTYYLHPSFSPSVVTRDSRSDSFRLSFTAWGQFEIKAKVYFNDGTVKDLSRFLSF
jgi:hypothetical protein